MDDDGFEIKLGSRQWKIQRLPFGVVRQAQPRALRQLRRFPEGGKGSMADRQDETALEEQLRALALALRTVDDTASVETLDRMVFTVAELGVAMRQVLMACGGVTIPQTSPAGSDADGI